MTPCIGEILRLHSKQRIKEQPQSTWLEAYNLRGTGSTFNRKHKVEAIYARWVPVPDGRGDPVVKEFLDEIKHVVTEAIEVIKEEVKKSVGWEIRTMSNIKLFESKQIRSIWDDKTQRWLFAVVDIVAALSESQNPQVYWRVLKKRLLAEGNETVTNCNALKMTAPDGKQRLTDVADTEQLLRLIQSVPSPKAEPFKRWLAKVGYERLEEIENPELAAARMRELYKAKGCSDEWIEKRVRGIAIRDELTNEWKKRGVKEQREYSILTAEISRATFGMTPTEYKEFNSLDKPADNLRDLEKKSGKSIASKEKLQTTPRSGGTQNGEEVKMTNCE